MVALVFILIKVACDEMGIYGNEQYAQKAAMLYVLNISNSLLPLTIGSTVNLLPSCHC